MHDYYVISQKCCNFADHNKKMRRILNILVMLIMLQLSLPMLAETSESCRRPVEYPLESGISMPERQQAMLADNMPLSLMPSAGRTQRIVPGNGGFGGFSGGYGNTKKLYNPDSLFNAIYGGVLSRHNARRIVSAAPCDYYVFALMRLRC